MLFEKLSIREIEYLEKLLKNIHVLNAISEIEKDESFHDARDLHTALYEKLKNAKNNKEEIHDRNEAIKKARELKDTLSSALSVIDSMSAQQYDDLMFHTNTAFYDELLHLYEVL